jgi:hypothetical protein
MSTGAIVVILVNVAWLVPFVFFMVRMSRREDASRAERRRILGAGVPATAVVRAREVTGPYYSHVGHLEITLDVALPGAPPYPARARAVLPTIDYPRVQVGCTLEVRVDPADRAKVAIVGDRVD